MRGRPKGSKNKRPRLTMTRAELKHATEVSNGFTWHANMIQELDSFDAGLTIRGHRTASDDVTRFVSNWSME